MESWGTATAVDSAHAADFWFSYEIVNRGDDFAREICDIAFNVYIGGDNVPAITYDLGPDLGSDGCLHNFRPGGTPVQRASRRIPISLNQMAAIDTGQPIRVVLSRYVLSTEDYYASDAATRGLTVALEDGAGDGDETIDAYLIPTWKPGETVLQVLARYFPHRTDANGMLTAIWTPEYRSDTPGWCREPKRPVDQPTKALWCKHELSVADWWNIYTDGLGDGSEGFQDTPAVPGAVALFRFNQDTDHDGFSDRSEARLGTDPKDASSFPYPELLAGVHQVRNGNQVVATLSLLNIGFYDAYGVEAVMVAPDDSVGITNNTVGGSGRVRAQKQVIVGSRILPQSPLPVPWTQSGHAALAVGGYYTGTVDLTYTFTVNCPAGGCSVGSGAWTLGWNDGVGGSGSLNFGDGYASPTFLPVSKGVTLALYSGSVQNGESFTVAARTPRDTFQYTVNREPYTEPLVIVSYNDPQGNHRFVVPPEAMDLAAPADNLEVFAGQMLGDAGVDLVTSAEFAPGVNSLDLLVNNPTDATLDNAHLFLEIVNVSGTVVSEVPTQVDLGPGPTYVEVAFNSGSFSPAYMEGDDYIVMAFLTDYQGNILDTSGRPLSSFQVDPLPKLALDAAGLTWDFGSVPQGTLLKRPLALANVGFGPLYMYLSPAPGLALGQGAADTVAAADLSSFVLTLRTGEVAQGSYDHTVTLKTSDPANPTRSLRVQGTITAPTGDTPGGGLLRPLDVPVVVTGPKSQGEWVEFTHNLGPDPQSLHPVRVFDQSGTTLHGVGKFATDFAAGTASYEMFGDGRDGVMPGSGNLDYANGFGAGSVNGSAGSTSISVTSRHEVQRINPGDVVLIHQTRGNGAGNWELNKAVSDFTGSGAFDLQNPLGHSYMTNTGNERAQILRVPQYSDCQVTGTVTPLGAWNGYIGGIFVVMCMGTMEVSGSISVAGQGFKGAPGTNPTCGPWNPNFQGESYNGNSAQSHLPNYGAGGGGDNETGHDHGNYAGGGGGGHATSGGTGVLNPFRNPSSPLIDTGQGGGTYGSSDLTQIFLGSGGGQGGNDWKCPGGGAGYGGNGGGIAILYTRELVLDAGLITVAGQDGYPPSGSNSFGGGGGSGGSLLVTAGTIRTPTGILSATGGKGGYWHDSQPNVKLGGDGGVGRIRVKYCEVPTAPFATNPVASTQPLTCYIVEQIGSAPYTIGRLNLPESIADGATTTYAVQYGRKLDYAVSGDQVSSLRLPAGMLAAASLDLLVSAVGSGNVTLRLDTGDDGSWEYETTQAVTDAESFPVANLATAFNAYWETHGAPATGTLDVPVTVELSRAGKVLLTNLQIEGSGSKLRPVRMPAQSLSAFNLDFSVEGTGSGDLTIALDVGDNGSIDWTYSEASDFPRRLLTGDLSTAVNAYLAGKSGLVDVPFRLFVAPDRGVTVNDYRAVLTPVLDLTAGAPSIGGVSAATAPTEGDIVPVSATLNNPSGSASGPVTAAFFAGAPGWGDWYIGSAFVANIPAGGSAPVSANWNTTGFYGDVPVKVVVNPYGRLAETGVGNNVGTTSVFVEPQAKLAQSISFGALPAHTLGDPPFTVSATASSGLPVTLNSDTPGVCSVVGSTVTLATVGTCTLTASQGGDGVYAAAEPVSQSFLVRSPTEPQLPQTITFAPPADHILGDAPFALNATASSGLPVSFISTTPGVCSVSGSTVALVATGACTITASQAGNTTYAAAPSVTRVFAVRATQIISFTQPADHVLGDAPFALNVTVSSGLPVALVSTTPSVCAVSGKTITLLAVGTCTIVASQPGDASFTAAADVQRSFAVSAVAKLAQTIAFPNPGAQTLGAGSVALAASASSGLAVIYRSESPQVCAVNGSVAALLAAGTCRITALQPGNDQYAAAAAVIQEFSVTPASPGKLVQTIDFPRPSDHRLTDPPFTLGALASSGLSVSFRSETPAVCTVAGTTVSLVGVGVCTLVASQAGNDVFDPAPNVTQSFGVLGDGPEKLAQTITFPRPGDHWLTDPPFTLAATASSGLPVSYRSESPGVCAVTDGLVTLVGVGTCRLIASQSGNSVFAPAADVAQTFEVSVAPGDEDRVLLPLLRH